MHYPKIFQWKFICEIAKGVTSNKNSPWIDAYFYLNLTNFVHITKKEMTLRFKKESNWIVFLLSGARAIKGCTRKIFLFLPSSSIYIEIPVPFAHTPSISLQIASMYSARPWFCCFTSFFMLLTSSISSSYG